MEFIVGICFTVRPIRTIIGAVIEVGIMPGTCGETCNKQYG